jgi:hypothetical protein
MDYEELCLTPAHPRVQLFVREAIEPHFRDTHCMLLLPNREADLEAGCNFAIAQVLLNVISGISTTLFAQAGRTGVLFKQLLNEFYWTNDPPGGLSFSEATAILYDDFRNPLVHALGFRLRHDRDTHSRRTERSERRFQIERFAKVDEPFLRDLESGHRPPIGPTLEATGNVITLRPEGLYWGTRQMIEALVGDEARMNAAEEFLRPVVTI